MLANPQLIGPPGVYELSGVVVLLLFPKRIDVLLLLLERLLLFMPIMLLLFVLFGG